MTDHDVPVRTRSRARRLALQALYRWQMNEEDAIEVELQFHQNPLAARSDMSYFNRLFRGVIDKMAEIDAALASHVNRPLEQVDPVERAALRIGVYEISFCMDIPKSVAINEAVDLSKMFGSDVGYKYVNAVLDSYAKSLPDSKK